MKTFKSKFIVYSGIFLLIIAVGAGCKKSSDTPATPAPKTPGTNEVLMQNNTFNPSTITVTKGTTVTWNNQDSYAHTVTSNSGLFDSGNIAGVSGTYSTGGTFSFKFDSTGTYGYHCKIHSGMTGSVVVN
jgi:plastocyanin